MTTLLPFILRNWQALLGGLAVLVLSGLLWSARSSRDHWESKYTAEHNASILFASRVQATSEQIQRKALENARRIESQQQAISQESSREYQARIAELRARVDRMRNSGAGSGGGGGGVSVVSEPASGPDDPASQDGLPSADAVIATEQAIRLEELQGWVRRQVEVR